MELDRVDKLVAVSFVVIAGSTVGMVFDYWKLVYYSIPLMAVGFILMGALNMRDEWNPGVVVRLSAFGGVFVGLFIIADIALHTDALFGGLPAATAAFLYVIWPVTVVVGPLLFAWVYTNSLRQDHDETSAESTAYQYGSRRMN